VIDIRQFFQATNPARVLDFHNESDRAFYIDFSEVRGEPIIEEIKDRITFFEPDSPTCTLFTGHIGCGKSTELLRLGLELEPENWATWLTGSPEELRSLLRPTANDTLSNHRVTDQVNRAKNDGAGLIEPLSL